MDIVKKKIDTIRPNIKNTRAHGEAQIQEIMKSVNMFGLIRPIIIDENGEILAGHGLFEALKRLDYTECDCVEYNGLTQSQKYKLMLADNKIASMGYDNYNIIEEIMKEIDDFDIPGYNPEDLNLMYGDMDESDFTDSFVLPNEEIEKKKELNDEPKKPTINVEQAREEHYNPIKKQTDSTNQSKDISVDYVEIICGKCGEIIRVKKALL